MPCNKRYRAVYLIVTQVRFQPVFPFSFEPLSSLTSLTHPKGNPKKRDHIIPNCSYFLQLHNIKILSTFVMRHALFQIMIIKTVLYNHSDLLAKPCGEKPAFNLIVKSDSKIPPDTDARAT